MNEKYIKKINEINKYYESFIKKIDIILAYYKESKGYDKNYYLCDKFIEFIDKKGIYTDVDIRLEFKINDYIEKVINPKIRKYI